MSMTLINYTNNCWCHSDICHRGCRKRWNEEHNLVEKIKGQGYCQKTFRGLISCGLDWIWI